VFRLADSVPQSKREAWIRERESIAETALRADRELTAEEEERIRFLYSERIEQFLDSGHGECLLRQPAIADLVAGALRHFEGQRYILHSWCVMPNHVHVIVQPLPGHDLSKIIHSWKSFTAHEINHRLGRTGDVWQHDAYNHIIRSAKEYSFQIAYVWENPDKAQLPSWHWRWVITRASRSGFENNPD
jgi:REP element-mobilizing transposase RayT